MSSLESVAINGNFDSIDVLNISLLSTEYPCNMKTSIDNYDGLLICGAGNNGVNIDNAQTIYHNGYPYPARYGSEQLHDEESQNIIVVGALDQNGNRWSDSNYGYNTVDIYAPGINILSTYPEELDNGSGGSTPSGYKIDSGTSYATPMVTGVAALLLSVNPDLTALQLKECILGGADYITISVPNPNPDPSDESDQYIQQYVKKLNAWGAFKYLMKNYPIYSCELVDEDVQLIYNMDANASYMKDNTVMVKLDLKHYGDFSFNISANQPINVTLYDEDLDVVATTQTIINNGNTVSFSADIERTHYLRINYQNSEHEGTVTINVDCSESEHAYNGEYLIYSSTHHRMRCTCGEYGPTSPHVVNRDEIVLNMGFCMFCGARVLLSDDIVQAPFDISQQVTLNGSYILPNGIIVLVDEDIEAYLNGTLVWYDKDNLPQIQ